MPSATALLHPPHLPVNAHPHVRLQLRLAAHAVPYLRPVVVLTNAAGARL